MRVARRIPISSRAASLGLLVFLLFAVAMPVMPAWAEEVPTTIGLNGSWKLERTENFEQYLKQSGTSWWKRKLANLASSRLRTKIEQNGIEFEIESDSPVETRVDNLVADGKTSRSVENAAGDLMTWVARIEGSALIVDGRGEIGRRSVRREIVDGSMLMTITNPDADTSCKLYFERDPAE